MSSKVTTRVLILSLAIIGVLCVLENVSNASVGVSAVSHVSNFKDEAWVTIRSKHAESLATFQNDLGWGTESLWWPVFWNSWFGLETLGRRIIAVAIATFSMLYLLAILRRYRVLGPVGIVFVGVLYTLSIMFARYASFGLTNYTLLLLYSTVFIHVLCFSARSKLGYRHVLVGVILLPIAGLLNVRSLVGMCAIIAAMVLAQAWMRGLSKASVRDIALKHGILMLVPIGLGVMMAGYAGAPTNPKYYFNTSGLPANLYGVVEFACKRSLELAVSAFNPHSSIPDLLGLGHWLEPTCVLALFVGLAWSLCSPGTPRFAIALAFILGAGAHLLLAYFAVGPYGEMRYLLTFIAFFPVLAALGFSDVFRAVRWLLSSRAAPSRMERLHLMSTPVAIAIVICLLAIQAVSTAAIIRANRVIGHKERAVADAVLKAQAQGTSGLVVDEWTRYTLPDLESAIDVRNAYVFSSVLWKDQTAKDLENLNAWQAFVDHHAEMLCVTSVPFAVQHQGALFEYAANRFVIEQINDPRTLYLTHLRRKSADMNLWPADGNTKAEWSLRAATLSLADGGGVVATLEPGVASVERHIAVSVNKGDTLRFSARVEAKEAATLKLVLKRDEHGAFDGGVTTHRVVGSRVYEVTHTFERGWSALGVGVHATSASGGSVAVSDFQLRTVAK